MLTGSFGARPKGTERSTLHEQIVKPLKEADLAQRALVAQTAYGDVLAQIAEADSAKGEERSHG